MEVASPGPHLPRRAQRQALQPPCRGLEHQAHTSPRQRRTTMEQAGVPQPSPPPLRHTRAHTHRHGGISRPRAPPRGLGAVNSPVGLVTGHPGTAAQSGPAGKAARTVGRRPGEALTQPNPTQPPLVQALPCPGTGARLTIVFLVFSDHGCRGQKCNVTRLWCDCRGKSGAGSLERACGTSSCSYQHFGCSCNPMLSVLMEFSAMANEKGC